MGPFLSILLIFSITLGVSLLVIPLIIKLSVKFSLTDKAGKRKRHKREVSTLGGVIIYFAFMVSYFVFLDPESISGYFMNPIAFSLLFITGLYDDIYPLNASKKFFFQIVSAILLVYFADIHHSSYFTQLAVNEEIVKVVSVIFIVFIINAYNLVDGVNGLSAMLSMVAISGFGIWFLAAGFQPLAYVCFSISASIFGFLRYNLINTRIFLGDNGSMFLGLIVAFLSTLFIQYNQNLPNEAPFKLIAPFGVALAAMAIPILDTIKLFLMRSVYLLKSPFKADRNHLHHLLLRLKLSHAQISLLLTGITIVFLLFSYSIQRVGNTSILIIISLMYVALLMTLDYFIFNRYRKNLHKRTVFNEAIRIKEGLKNPLLYEFFFALSFFVLAVAIPFHRVSTSIPTVLIWASLLALFIRHTINRRLSFLSVVKDETSKFFKHPYSILVLLFVVFYTVHFIVFPTDGNISLSLKYMLLIYWIPLFELRKVINIKPSYILKAYIYGCFGFSFFILYHAFFSYQKLGWNAFFYSDLLSHVKANPITHSLYFNLAIIFIAGSFRTLKTKIWKLIHLFMLMFFVFMIILFNSKIGFIGLMISISASVFYLIKSNKNRIILIISSMFLASLSYLYVPFVQDRIDGFVLRIEKHDELHMMYKLPRLIVWEESIKVIKENWLWGTGVGNSMSTLEKQYAAINYQKGIERRFNTHNQFFEITLQTGIFGLISFVALLAYCFLVAFKNRSMIYLLFLSIILLYMLVESLFETQMGMVAFAFFNALFMSSFGKNKMDLEIE